MNRCTESVANKAEGRLTYECMRALRCELVHTGRRAAVERHSGGFPQLKDRGALKGERYW